MLWDQRVVGSNPISPTTYPTVSSTSEAPDAERKGNARKRATVIGRNSTGIITDAAAQLEAACAAETFEDENDWLAWPEKGWGTPFFCPVRWLAYTERFSVDLNTPAPALPSYFPDPIPSDRWARRCESGLADYTYFAKNKLDGTIKIGRSKQPSYRISTLHNDARGMPASKLAIVPNGELERAYHRLFARWRVEGEWFAPHPEILAEVERIKSEYPQ
jgi:hypothetical protein